MVSHAPSALACAAFSAELTVQLGYGAFIVLAHALWFSAVALFFSSASVRSRLLAVRHWIDRIFGGLLVGFGMLLALTQPSR